MLLIQIGGLGIITFMTAVMLLFNRKIGISDRLLIQDAFNLSTLSGIVAFVKKVLIGTLTVESIGACFYMTVFVPQFGARGIWVSVFNSVSAFCNAGMDIIGENSLCDYSGNVLITLTTAALIILGGLGYIVWWDVSRVIKNRKQNGGNNKNENVIKLGEKHTLIPICPETFACLPTPRVPSEIRDGSAKSVKPILKNGRARI